MIEFFKLLRVKDYIKNFLIFIPLFFSGNLFNIAELKIAMLGWVTFSLLASSIYIINDLKDVEHDKRHQKKKHRPLASGAIKKGTAAATIVVLLLLVFLISYEFNNVDAQLCLLGYFVLNIAYSMGLKNRPIIDVVILASGFVIRVFYGGFITNIEISKWLYLVIVTGSLYMGLGKRRNELKRESNTREVLKSYNIPFLDKNMYVCVALANAFYALWTMEIADSAMTWTVPLFIIILMSYSLDTEMDSDGDPVEVILNDKVLMITIAGYALLTYIILY